MSSATSSLSSRFPRAWVLGITALLLAGVVVRNSPSQEVAERGQDRGSQTSSAGAEEQAVLEPSPGDLKTLAELRGKLDLFHYRHLEVDDEFSSQLLDHYLDALDPSHWYLTQVEIDVIETFRHRLDDALEVLDLRQPYAIFRIFQARRVERSEFLLKLLHEEFDSLTFDGDDWLELDRSKSPWAKNQAELDGLWRARFKNDVLNLRLAGKEQSDIAEVLEKRYAGNLRRAKQVKSTDVFRVYCNALASVYGPHTEYFPPLEAENFDIRMSLSFEGIGALLGTDDEFVRIESILPGGPAERDGTLKATDRIVAVAQGDDGEFLNVVGWRTDEVVEHVRGPKGTKVRLEILPDGENDLSKSHVLTLVRDEVKLEESDAQSHVLEVERGDRNYKIGFIELPSFYVDFDAVRRGDPNYKSSTRDVAVLLEELRQQKVDGVVIDLRGNSGGSLMEAQDLVGLFVGKEPVVQVRSSDGDVEVLGSEHKQTWDGPVAVLVDRLSASASEIFAAALQDSGRGVILGSRTFGKGTVQNLMPMNRGQLKVTLAKFYRTSGGSTQHRGVEPDVEFPSLYDPDDIGESSLTAAMPWDEIGAVEHEHAPRVAQVRDGLVAAHEARAAKDVELRYLERRIEMSREQRADTRLSLNEAMRRQQQDEDEARLVAIENEKRVALGLEPVESLDQLPNEVKDPEDVYRENPFVMESAQVLVDFLRSGT